MAALPPPNIPPMTAEQATAFLTGPGGRFELVPTNVRGEVMKYWKESAQSVREIWLEAVKEFGDRDYLVYSRQQPAEDERLTYAQTGHKTAVLANVLRQKYGIKKGTHVALAMRNYPEFLISFFALQLLGAVVVNINCFLLAHEQEYCVLDGESILLIVDGERAQLLGGLPALAKIPMLVCRAETYKIPRGDSIEALMADFERRGITSVPHETVEIEDNSVVFFTSGTTGKPKGALHTQRAVVGGTIGGKYNTCYQMLRMGYGPEFHPKFKKTDPQSCTIICTPLFHVTASTATSIPNTVVGTKIVLMYKWDVTHAMQLIQREKVTGMTAVPSMHIQIMEAEDRDKYDLSSLTSILSGGAPAPSSLADNVVKKYNGTKSPVNGWGMSETLVGVIMNLGADYISHPTSIGRVTPHHEVKYVDEKGNEVPVGESGELALRGPQVLKEYYKKDEANSKSFLPGRFFLTGDVGKVDKDGFHYLLDRAKDMLIRAGENIWTYTVLRVWRYLPLTFFSRPPSAAYQSTDCIDVENALYQHPAVLDCAAVGLPHRVLGEEVAAVVTLKKEFRGKVSAQDIIAHCKKNLSSFKVPVFVLFYDETLPRNPTGKIVKPPLRDVVKAAATKAGVAKL